MSFLLDIGQTTGSTGNPHEHTRAVDPHGDGNTNIKNDHLHLVINGKVMPAGDDDHTHDDIPFAFKNAPERF